MPVTDRRLEPRLAELLGLERSSVGVNAFRTPSGDAPVWVDHLWILFGWPSFQELWYLVGVAATARAQPLPRERVAWVPSTDVLDREDGLPTSGVAADLAWDSFSDAVNSIRTLGRSPGAGGFDGISYQLWFESCCVSGGLGFVNPDRADLTGVERAAFALARGLQEATRSPALDECLKIWARSLSRQDDGG